MHRCVTTQKCVLKLMEMKNMTRAGRGHLRWSAGVPQDVAASKSEHTVGAHAYARLCLHLCIDATCTCPHTYLHGYASYVAICAWMYVTALRLLSAAHETVRPQQSDCECCRGHSVVYKSWLTFFELLEKALCVGHESCL
jgi:hypothetical protein